MGQRPDYRDCLTVYVISSGEPSLAECKRRLLAQDCLFQLEEIRGVTPMTAAFQRMLDCETPYFVQVDADMLLESGAVNHLYVSLTGSDEQTAIYCGWLWGDAEERPIQGVKAYRTDIVKRYPYTDSASCEMGQIGAMEADGYRVSADPCPDSQEGCLGLHYSLQTPERAYRRWRRLVEKHRRYPWMSWVAGYPAKLMARSELQPSEVNRAAALGALAGLVGELGPDTEDNASIEAPGYRRAVSYLSPGPSELVVYATDRCNFKCWFCSRTKAPPAAGDQLDISMGLVEHCLNSWPTIQGVCIAGFGEPLLHPELHRVIETCQARGRSVGLITNGALLTHRLHQLPQDLSYLSVSLNALTQESHKEHTGSDTWGHVLDGVRMASSHGYNVGLSFVVSQASIGQMPEALELAHELGAHFVNFPALLPHDGQTDGLLMDTAENRTAIAAAEKHPSAGLVCKWPVLMDEGGPRRSCTSPFRVMGVDPREHITGCRRVMPPASDKGSARWPGVWHGQHHVNLRQAMLGDRDLPEECRHCWACWEDY